MSKQKFQMFDLLFLSALAAVIEIASAFVMAKVNGKIGAYPLSQMVNLSFSCLLGVIAIFRWNILGLMVPIIGGASSLIVRILMKQNLSIQFSLFLVLGYVGLLSCLLFLHKRDKRKMSKDKGMMILYYFVGYLSVEVVRALCLIGSENYFLLLLNLMPFDLINAVISFLVYLVALKQDGFVVDMNDYLHDLNDIERRKSKEPICLDELCEGNEINEAALLDGGTLSTEDLRKMEDDRRKFEGRSTVFDDENEAIEAYKRKREALKHGKK